MKKGSSWLLVFVILLAGAGAAYYFWLGGGRPAPAPVEQAALPPVKPTPSEPMTRYPVPTAPTPPAAAPAPAAPAPSPAVQPAPLPALDDSDPVMKADVAPVVGGVQTFETLFEPRNFVRRVVVTADNLSDRRLPLKYLPLKTVPGSFLVSGEEGDQSISPDNYARYAPYVHMVQGVDVPRLMAVYVRFYPLFQKAYEELGYPSAYFNDRLVETIDTLLATPEPTGPVKLVRPSVYFKYADPKLEALTSGQKVLIRMGPANAAIVKAKLRELRQALTHLGQGAR